MKQNAMTLARTNGQQDFEEMIDDLKKKTHNEAYQSFDKFMKDKDARSSSNNLCVEAYEGILHDRRANERQ